MLAERNDAIDAGVPGAALQPRELRIVTIEHRGATALDAEEDFRLGVGDRLERAEELEVHRLDRRDDSNLRPHQLDEWLNLAGMVHANFEYRVACTLGTARERQRDAPMIVVGGERRMRLPTPRERQTQRFLGAGLADGAGDRDDLCTRARARCPRQVAQTFQDVRNDDERRTVRKLLALVGGDNRKAGARFERGRNEVVAITVIALDGEEGLAGRNCTRVDG